MNENIFRRIMNVDELAEGEMRAVTVDGREILVCHSKQGWYALDNVCTHAYAKMSEGRLRGVRLICPLHGASFDCRTGAIMGPPAIQPLATYPVRLVDTAVEIAVDSRGPR